MPGAAVRTAFEHSICHEPFVTLADAHRCWKLKKLRHRASRCARAQKFPGHSLERTSPWKAIGNVVVLALFFGSWLVRRDAPQAPQVLAHVLSFGGAFLSLATAWLGGELVDRLGVGVADNAHLDAPSSLTAAKVSTRTHLP
jgi:uncharacterized membrane protein